ASFNFPGTGPGAQPRFGGGSGDAFSGDAFVARLTDDLTGFEEATFLGGSGDDLAIRLASPSFPVQCRATRRSRKSWISGTISSALSSKAKCPVSRRWNSTSGRSRLYGCAPSAGKILSFLPQTMIVGGRCSRKYACTAGYSGGLVR